MVLRAAQKMKITLDDFDLHKKALDRFDDRLYNSFRYPRKVRRQQ